MSEVRCPSCSHFTRKPMVPVSVLRERIMTFGGMQRTDRGAFWIDRDDVLRLLDEVASSEKEN